MQRSMKSPLKRIVCLVADGFGIGAAPDAVKYGDEGSNTLGNLARAVGGIRLSNLEKLGLGNLGEFQGISSTRSPEGVVARLAEKSEGKDTTTGHWEIAGLITREPFALYPNGFPAPLVEAWVREANLPGILGNKAASGTVIIDELGVEHVRTGKPILYTSGDSVFQIAAHEESFGLDPASVTRSAGELARKTHGPLSDRPRQLPARLEAPDVKPSNAPSTDGTTLFHRGKNCLDLLVKNGIEVLSVGKIEDIFDHRGISAGNHTGNNIDSLKATLDNLKKKRGGESVRLHQSR